MSNSSFTLSNVNWDDLEDKYYLDQLNNDDLRPSNTWPKVTDQQMKSHFDKYCQIENSWTAEYVCSNSIGFYMVCINFTYVYIINTYNLHNTSCSLCLSALKVLIRF